MESNNFEFLREHWPDLATLGGYAEQYAWTDPASAMVKLRSFCERTVDWVYGVLKLPRIPGSNLYDLLDNDAFRSKVQEVVLGKFHHIRIQGNKAAHGEEPDSEKAIELLRDAFDISRWLFVATRKGTKDQCPQSFIVPQKIDADTDAKVEREKRAVLEKLAAKEAHLQELLDRLEAERTAKETAQKKAEELEALLSTGQEAVDVLGFSEEATRQRLIDEMLAEAGWNVGAGGKSTEEVGQEIEVPDQPTPSGIGYADYVLWDDNGKPLGVVEAKKTAVSAEKGRTQARLYADGLEKKYGQRPVIFYTNGYDIWIWDDAQKYPPRKLFGIYSKDSLQYLLFQRNNRQQLDTIKVNNDITDRLYQQLAIKQVCERFTDNHRKALIVQATGTGKTRVAISLTDVLLRASWVKRVLFLCDRTELRKQAKNAFSEHLSEGITIVRKGTAKERHKRIYLATYPAMMKVFQTFDVGFFDLIIADESHRSIYNRYRELFLYFDCFQIGLTATPVDMVNRNTYRLFGCEERMPTAHYSLDEAVEEGYLTPMEVFTHSTQFLKRGIKYKNLTEEQIEQLEEDGEDPTAFDYDAREVDNKVYNKETNRIILRNLMDNGIRDVTGQYPGKTIIFARSHRHAELLKEVFDELYPQYGGSFCQVIDNYDPRAEQLIDDFKTPNSDKNKFFIAISVDMLDTGIDIPEVVNLVFAKPIKSKVKFWQMIGRGTRLCKDLFGPGTDKTRFRIFDHWANFEYFDMQRPEVEHLGSKSLMQKVFEARIELAETAQKKAEYAVVEMTVALLEKQIRALPDKTIAVKEKWRHIHTVLQDGVLTQFAPTTVNTLKDEIAPLMQWINIKDSAEAYDFDLLAANLQTELLKKTGLFDDYKDKVLNKLGALQMHLNPVKAKAEAIKKVAAPEFWEETTIQDIEEARTELRGIMHYREKVAPPVNEPKVIDIADGEIKLEQRKANLESIDLKIYKQRVQEALEKLFDTDPVLKKIRGGQPVAESDLQALTKLVLTQNPNVDLETLKEFYPEAMPLDFIIRSIIGMDADAVAGRFSEFVQHHPGLSAKQIQFLKLLQNHISKFGAVEIDRLYEPPFTTLDSDGPDGVFQEEAMIEELLSIVETFKPKVEQAQ